MQVDPPMNADPYLMNARAIVLAFVIGFGAISLTNESAWSAGEKDQASLILSNLPAKASAAYKALPDLASAAEGEDLDTITSEKWLVPQDRNEVRVKVAAEKNVRASRFRQDLHQILEPVVRSEKMSSKQQARIQRTRQSTAAIDVRMMKLPAPDVLDYSLTNPDAPPTLVIPLKDDTSVTLRRTSLLETTKGFEWRGLVEETGEPVTILSKHGTRLAGIVNYGGLIYVVKCVGGELHAVVEFSPDRMPPEHAPASNVGLQKMNMREDPLVRQGDASMMQPDAGPLSSLKMGSPARREEPKDTTITLLVAYTKNAASSYFHVEDLVDLAVAEANQSFRASGIDNVRLEVARTYQTDYEESGSHFEHVYRFRNNGDGYMDEVHDMRDKYGADISALIVDDPNGCGLSIRIAADASDAFAVMHHECMATMHTLSHEIGHLIGARHDRALDNTSRPFPYGHGFVNGNDWHTIMSYKDSCNGCGRLPIWSSPKVKIKGVAAGDPNTDNARVIREQAQRVARFRSAATPDADRMP